MARRSAGSSPRSHDWWGNALRYVLLALVCVFPFLFGVMFAIAVMSFGIPTPAGVRAGRVAAFTSVVVRALLQIGLTVAGAVALHQTMDESIGTATALMGGPFLAGVIAMPVIVRRVRSRGEDRARGET